mgnify:CR=1 FL=1
MIVLVWLILILMILYLLAIMPRIIPRPMHEFKGWYYAHRGFHDNKTDAPENSKKAFALAVKNGYGIELDIQLTKDEKVVVFHDATLKRACGIDAKVNSMTYEELKHLRLFDSNETIPLFSEVLKVIDGKVPLIMEIKMVDKKIRICELAAKELEGYQGIYCMESFHPFAVRWFRKHRPEVCRGQLSAKFGKETCEKEFYLFLVRFLLTNIMTRPDFIAYSHEGANNISRNLCRLFGATSVAWTIRTKEELKRNKNKFDLFIFEGFQAKRHEEKQ